MPQFETSDSPTFDIALFRIQGSSDADHRSGIEAARMNERWNARSPESFQTRRHVARDALLEKNGFVRESPVRSTRLRTINRHAILRLAFRFAVQSASPEIVEQHFPLHSVVEDIDANSGIGRWLARSVQIDSMTKALA